jgi:hypothetical protein
MGAPPGTVLATALDTSWEVADTNQPTWGSATRVSHQTHARLPASSRIMTMNHRNETSARRGTESHMSSSWGASP